MSDLNAAPSKITYTSANADMTAFHAAFDRAFLPLLKRLGFELAKPETGRPGQLVAMAVRSLGGAQLELLD